MRQTTRPRSTMKWLQGFERRRAVRGEVARL
jgi:hypothetical protein